MIIMNTYFRNGKQIERSYSQSSSQGILFLYKIETLK